MNMKCYPTTVTPSKIFTSILHTEFRTTDQIMPYVPFVSLSEQKEIEEILKNPECHEIVDTVTIEIKIL